jgi:hypothetical protein
LHKRKLRGGWGDIIPKAIMISREVRDGWWIHSSNSTHSVIQDFLVTKLT